MADPITQPAPAADDRRSRRAILAGLVGGLGAWALGAVDEVTPAAAASGDPVRMGRTNKAGSGSTIVQGSTTGNVLRVQATTTKSGSGAAIRADGGKATGVRARSSAAGGYAVEGANGATSGNAIGVYGRSASASGLAMYGYASAQSGMTYGVYGRADSPAGHGVFGYANAASGTNYGVYGYSNSPSGAGVRGRNVANGTGVMGDSAGGAAVFGQTSTGNGVYGQATSGSAVLGSSGSGNGVLGASTSGLGVVAMTTTGTALYVLGPTSGAGNAGTFLGNVHVSGTLSKVAGAFRIDHPLEPGRKYLQHSFVESPDMMNIYSGVVDADAKGRAVVELPRWFDALNRDVRYSLTPIGGAMPELHVAHEIADNRFSIGGARPNGRVSWMVTGVRHDAWAEAHRIEVEVEKTGDARGRYLTPEEHGRPASEGLGHEQRRAARGQLRRAADAPAD